MIKHMFVFGVVVPTLITVTVFVGFLVCWFKFNVRERLMKSRLFVKHFGKQLPDGGRGGGAGGAGAAAMHDSVVFSPSGGGAGGAGGCPGLGSLWQDSSDRRSSDAGQAMLTAPTDTRGRLRGLDWPTTHDDDDDDNEDERRAAQRGPTATGRPTADTGRPTADTANERVPQTFRFPAIGGRDGKLSDADGHVMGILQMTGSCPEDTDYGHFIPLTGHEREECWRRRSKEASDRQFVTPTPTPTSCLAADKDGPCPTVLAEPDDCPTGPGLAQGRRSVLEPAPAACGGRPGSDQVKALPRLFEPTTIRPNVSPSPIAAI